MLMHRDLHSSHRSSQDANGLQPLVLLRVLRNACAAGPAAAEVLQASSVHTHAAQLAADIAQAQVEVTTLDPEQCKEQHQLLLAALQLLANLCAASIEAAAAVWAVLFPDRLQSILAVLQGKVAARACTSTLYCCWTASCVASMHRTSAYGPRALCHPHCYVFFAVDVHEVAALVVLYCIRACSAALAGMTSTAAGSIWLKMLAPVMSSSTSSSTDGSTQQQQQQQSSGLAPCATGNAAAAGVDTAGNDNLCLLVKAVTLQYDRLQQVMQCLQLSKDTPHGDSSAACDTVNTASSSSSSSSQLLLDLEVNVAHAVLLHIVETEMGTVPDAKSTLDSKQQDAAPQQSQEQQQQQRPLGWLACLVGLVRQLSSQVSSSAAECDTVAVHVLEATLQASVKAAVSSSRERFYE
jgi:hypothetical protein